MSKNPYPECQECHNHVISTMTWKSSLNWLQLISKSTFHAINSWLSSYFYSWLMALSVLILFDHIRVPHQEWWFLFLLMWNESNEQDQQTNCYHMTSISILLVKENTFEWNWFFFPSFISKPKSIFSNWFWISNWSHDSFECFFHC